MSDDAAIVVSSWCEAYVSVGRWADFAELLCSSALLLLQAGHRHRLVGWTTELHILQPHARC